MSVRFNTKYLADFLIHLDELRDTDKITIGEYMQVGLLLKILRAVEDTRDAIGAKI